MNDTNPSKDDIKAYNTPDASENDCSVCGIEARVKIDGKFYCWHHGEHKLEGDLNDK